ncbi:MAG: hypothetical protein HYR49_10840 [Gammaproteobacteria bacterium]|nr:hypothetical protein [Gammaproteobacteria bacterium]
MRVILIIFLIWGLWASISMGGLYKLRQMNAEFDYPNKSVPFLLSKLSYSQSNGYWDSYHVEQCSLYMPNWTKAERCVTARLSCEYVATQKKNLLKDGEHADIFSDEFHSCWLENRPLFGPVEWLRASRGLLRAAVVFGVTWLTGGWDKEGEEALKWENNNKGWVRPLIEWMERAG